MFVKQKKNKRKNRPMPSFSPAYHENTIERK